MPGIDTTNLADQSSAGAMARVSIFALGIVPLFTMLTYAEIAKLIFPSLARWIVASSGNAFLMSTLIKSIVLIITAAQGYEILYGLAAMELVDGSPSVMIAGIASFVGASAVMIWLAGLVRLPNLRDGVWFVLAVPLLEGLLRELVMPIEFVRTGAVSAMDLLLAGSAITLAVAMIVFANRLLSQKDEEPESSISLAVLLWPPFLANTIAGYLIVLPLILAPEWLYGGPWRLNMVFLALSAILVPLFIYAYYRYISIWQPDIARKNNIRPILLALAVIEVLVCVGMELLNQAIPFPFIPGGGSLIVCVTVLLVLGDSLKSRWPQSKLEKMVV